MSRPMCGSLSLRPLDLETVTKTKVGCCRTYSLSLSLLQLGSKISDRLCSASPGIVEFRGARVLIRNLNSTTTTMLSNHLQNEIEAPKLAWSRLPNSEKAENDVVGSRKKSNEGGGVESLDYEVIENYAYWEEQAQRGRLYVRYYVAVKWFFALLIGIGTRLLLGGLLSVTDPILPFPILLYLRVRYLWRF